MADPTLYLFDGYNLLHAGPQLSVRTSVTSTLVPGGMLTVVYSGTLTTCEPGLAAIE